MEQQPISTVEGQENTQPENAVNFQKLLGQCLKYWYWFVISLVVCLALGWVYFKRAVPIYERQELIQVVSQDANTDISASLSQMGDLFNQNSQAMTELLTLTAPAAMIDVVKRLDLNVSYKADGLWHKTDLYASNLPVLVEFPGLDENKSAKAEFELLPGGKARIISVSRPGASGSLEKADDIDKVISYQSAETLKTSVGQIKIKPNPLYSGAAIAEPMTIHVTHGGVYPTAMSLSQRIKGEHSENSEEMLTLTLNDAVPQRAVDILNTVVSVYNENWIKERAELAESTSRFINDRLSVIEQKLSGVEGDISSFKSSHMVPDVSAASSIYLQQASEAGANVRDLSTRLAMTRYVRDFISAASNTNTILPANVGVADVNIESQIADYNRILMERNTLVANSSTSNPLVTDLDARLEGYRRALTQSLDNQITSLNTAISSAQRTEDISTGKVASTPGQARYLLSVERQQKVKESLYLFLLQKREENELGQKFVNSKIRVVSEPLGSPSPISPKRNSIMMLSFVLGLILPVGVLYGRQLLDTKVRSRHDIEHMTVPFMGELPKNPSPYGLKERRHRFQQTGEKSQGIVVEKENLNMINEAFRVLRTNLELTQRRDRDRGATVIALTSANPGSGKTFVTMNLAAATPSFWISIVSVLTTIAVLVWK